VHEASIRELDAERDATEVVELIRETDPLTVISRDSWMHRLRTVPARAQQLAWVAELDGQVVGYAFAFKNFFTEGSTSVFGRVVVAAPYRRRGIGSALHARMVEHASRLSAGSILHHFVETPDGVAFLTRRGYREVRAEQESVLDPRTITERPSPDLELRTIAEADPRDVYDVDLAATRDVPLVEPVDDVPYDEWEDHVLAHPHFTREGSFLAYVDGEPAAVSMLFADLESGRSANMFTGTHARFRGHGLALGVKLASIAWANDHGITSMATSNDERNAPMLAINRKLGYVPSARRVEYLREEGTASAPAPQAPAT
jgi:GNAT superfamily N-acetyltransferase